MITKKYIEKDIILSLIIPIFNLHTLAGFCIAYFLFLIYFQINLFSLYSRSIISLFVLNCSALISLGCEKNNYINILINSKRNQTYIYEIIFLKTINTFHCIFNIIN